MPDIADPIAALVALLKADSTVNTPTAGRVYGSELPKSEAREQPRKAVLIEAAGGVSPVAGSTAELTAQRVDAICYGETPFEAQELRRLVFGACKPAHRVVHASTLIHWIEDAGGSVDGRDRDTRKPFAAQSFQVFFAEREIA